MLALNHTDPSRNSMEIIWKLEKCSLSLTYYRNFQKSDNNPYKSDENIWDSDSNVGYWTPIEKWWESPSSKYVRHTSAHCRFSVKCIAMWMAWTPIEEWWGSPFSKSALTTSVYCRFTVSDLAMWIVAGTHPVIFALCYGYLSFILSKIVELLP